MIQADGNWQLQDTYDKATCLSLFHLLECTEAGMRFSTFKSEAMDLNLKKVGLPSPGVGEIPPQLEEVDYAGVVEELYILHIERLERLL